jgi:hypothetical protein
VFTNNTGATTSAIFYTAVTSQSAADLVANVRAEGWWI